MTVHHVMFRISRGSLSSDDCVKLMVVKLKAFSKFENRSEALSAATLLIDSKLSKGLHKLLRAHCNGETLVVQIDCVHNNGVLELMRGVRSLLAELISGLGAQDLAPMSLGLSHSLSGYKLKFSPDKAIGLLDDLDKELNTYTMGVPEWYSCHFPKLSKIVQDNILYAKAVKLMGDHTNVAKLDFSELEAALEQLGVDVAGEVALDLGLSTGGFTDCLLQYGASFVYGVDVGYGEVADKICRDERVMPVVVNLMKEETTLVTLIKPQFEARRTLSLQMWLKTILFILTLGKDDNIIVECCIRLTTDQLKG
ncbi:hypothetical protein LguiA_007733 [Lonicera macranthoides]